MEKSCVLYLCAEKMTKTSLFYNHTNTFSNLSIFQLSKIVSNGLLYIFTGAVKRNLSWGFESESI